MPAATRVKVVHGDFARYTDVEQHTKYTQLVEQFRALFSVSKKEDCVVGIYDPEGRKVILANNDEVGTVVSNLWDEDETKTFFIAENSAFDLASIHSAIESVTEEGDNDRNDNKGDDHPKEKLDIDHLRATFDALIKEIEKADKNKDKIPADLFDAYKKLVDETQRSVSLVVGKTGKDIEARIQFEVQRVLQHLAGSGEHHRFPFPPPPPPPHGPAFPHHGDAFPFPPPPPPPHGRAELPHHGDFPGHRGFPHSGKHGPYHHDFPGHGPDHFPGPPHRHHCGPPCFPFDHFGPPPPPPPPPFELPDFPHGHRGRHDPHERRHRYHPFSSSDSEGETSRERGMGRRHGMHGYGREGRSGHRHSHH